MVSHADDALQIAAAHAAEGIHNGELPRMNFVDLLKDPDSNRAAYDYTKDDIKKIFGAIESELKIAKAKFDIGDSDVKEKKFTLR